MATFLDTTVIGHAGTTVAIKDLIDVAGLPTTAGSRAIARSAQPAAADAACLAPIRAEIAAGTARIVGKVNLTELAIGISGINEWFGTPRNPLDPALVPGGSSSGSAVAVASGDAEVAVSTDTGGSVRIPAACCGVTGLKTSYGRVPLGGVFPASQTLDTVGPLARDVAGVCRGMELLEAGFNPAAAPARRVGRVRLPDVDPQIDAALDRALAEAELEAADVVLPTWEQAGASALTVILAGLWRNDGALVSADPTAVSAETAHYVMLGAEHLAREAWAAEVRRAWIATLDELFERHQLLALPTLSRFPPTLAEAAQMPSIIRTEPINLAGVPALAQPVRSDGPLPASLQLVGPHGSEELLLATGAQIEGAAGAIFG